MSKTKITNAFDNLYSKVRNVQENCCQEGDFSAIEKCTSVIKALLIDFAESIVKRKFTWEGVAVKELDSLFKGLLFLEKELPAITGIPFINHLLTCAESGQYLSDISSLYDEESQIRMVHYHMAV